MESLLIGIVGFVVMIILCLLKVPIFMALGIVGIVGIIYSSGFNIAMGIVGTLPFAVLASYGLAVAPLFFLMGHLAGEGGVVQDAYEVVYKLTGKLRGGLAMATIIASGFAAATMGSSTASAVLFTRVALPEMLRFGYDKHFSLGCIASAGTFAIMIPPSMAFVIYGIVTGESIGKLLVAGILPGILTVFVYLMGVWVRCKFSLKLAPVPEVSFTRRDKFRSIFKLWSVGLLFLLVFGGIYGGFFTPTAGGAVGAAGAFLLAFSRRRLTGTSLKKMALEVMQGLGSFIPILIGGFFLGRFLVLSNFVEVIVNFVTTDLRIPPMAVIGLLCIMYVVLGALMDEISMTLVTLPFVYPIVKGLGYDGIWWGVVFTKLCQIGLIFPPIAMNLFVVASSAGEGTDVKDVIKGIWPFILLEVLVLVLLILFPSISLFLPNKMYG